MPNSFRPTAGILFAKVNYTRSLLEGCGREFAKLNKILTSYSNETIENRTGLWALENAPAVEEYLDAVDDPERQVIVRKVLAEFRSEVLAKKEQFTLAIIHDDLNEQNLIVKKDAGERDYELAAILDFNDINKSIRVFDIAVFCAYAMLNDKATIGFLDMPEYILPSYCSNIDVSPQELAIIPVCIKARLCQSLVLGAHFNKLDPTNEYLLESSKTGWPVLTELARIPNAELIKMWIK